MTKHQTLGLTILILLIVTAGALFFLSPEHQNFTQPRVESSSNNRTSSQKNSVRDEKSSLAERTRFFSKRPNVVSAFKADSYNSEKFSTLTPDGILSPGSIEYSNLTLDEVVKVQQIFNEHKIRMLQLTKEHLKPDPLRGNTSEGIYAYTLSSFEEDGVGELKNLLAKIDSQIGSDRRESLLSGYPVETRFFAYGRDEVYFKVYNGNAAGGIEPIHNEEQAVNWRVESIYQDPKTGKVKGRSLNSLDAITSHYGNIFGFEEQNGK
jgi:hypothetical protein